MAIKQITLNTMLTLAGILSIVLGVIHSILGERMIFHTLRNTKKKLPMFKYRGILWATWHLVTLFGGCLGIYLLKLAGVSFPGEFTMYIIMTMLFGATLVFIGTKGRHPGWIALLLIAFLIWSAS